MSSRETLIQVTRLICQNASATLSGLADYEDDAAFQHPPFKAVLIILFVIETKTLLTHGLQKVSTCAKFA